MGPIVRVDGPWSEFASGQGRDVLAREVLPEYLVRQRWFPAKARTLSRVAVEEVLLLPLGNAVLCVVTVDYADGGRDHFAVPVAFAADDDADRMMRDDPRHVLAEVTGVRRGVLHDDMSRGLGASLALAMAEGLRWPAVRGEMVGEKTGAFDGLVGGRDVRTMNARAITGEQSNTSLVLGDALIVKLIRRLEPGLNPDYEIGRHLTDVVRFPGVPALAGALLWHAAGREPIVVAVAQAFVPGATPLRERVVPAIAAFMRNQLAGVSGASSWSAPGGADVPQLEDAAALGRKTGELHLALAEAHGDAAFQPEPASDDDLRAISRDMRTQVALALDVLARGATDLPPESSALAAHVLDARDRLFDAVEAMARIAPGLQRIRVHGDYQLDQVLLADDRFVIIDFEGEPLRPLEARRSRFFAVKDVAGMSRSYSYAAYTALFDVAGEDEDLAGRLDPVARRWQAGATASFVRGYRDATEGAAFVPSDPATFDTLLSAFLVEKATYELRYEIGHRPRWLRIPLRGMVDLLDSLGR